MPVWMNLSMAERKQRIREAQRQATEKFSISAIERRLSKYSPTVRELADVAIARLKTCECRNVADFAVKCAKICNMPPSIEKLKGRIMVQQFLSVIDQMEPMTDKRQRLMEREVQIFTFPKDSQRALPLPIYLERQQIAASTSSFLVIQSDTGSGKTLLCPLILNQTQTEYRNISVLTTFLTQPNRFAVNSVIASYRKIDASINAVTLDGLNMCVEQIVVCTPEELVLYLNSDGVRKDQLIKTSRFFFDEFHERTLFQDILFSYTAAHQTLFVISSQYVFMSATPDEELMSCVQTKKIEIRDNVPFNIESRVTKALNVEEVEDNTIVQECCRYVLEMAQNQTQRGNILCFCVDQLECQDVLRAVTAALRNDNQDEQERALNVISVVPDIRDSRSMDELRRKINEKCEEDKFNVVPLVLTEKTVDLFQRLAREDISDNCYKLILSNSVAESTVTIPHLAVVIDSGLSKENVWLFDKNIYEQRTVIVSDNMATQRKGRVGRTMDGISVKVELSDRGGLELSRPEVKRMDITNAALKLYRVKLDIEKLNSWLPSKIDPEEINRIKCMF